MTLAAVSLTPLSAQLDGGLRNSRASWSGRRGLLLQLVDRSGAIGQGEASPLPGYSPDTLEDCERSLCSLDWQRLAAEFLAEPGPASLAEALALLPESLPAARFALESALLELVAEQCCSWQLLGLPAAPSDAPVPRSELLSADCPEQRLADGRSALARGVTGLKVKLGLEDFQVELAGLSALRAGLGDDFALRLDANGGWSPAEARAKLNALAVLRPELVEEPVPWTQLGELAAAPVPLALDESLRDSACRTALAELAAAGLVQALVLKPTVLGGAGACLQLAAEARSHGLDSCVTHCFEGPVAYAATMRVARLLPEPLPCGLAAHGGLSMQPTGESKLCWST